MTQTATLSFFGQALNNVILNEVKNLNPHTAEILRYAQYDRPFTFHLSVFSLSFTHKAFVDILKKLLLVHLANGDIDVAVVDNAHL